jgi:hypothetical protein
MGHLLGYARASTPTSSPHLQVDTLSAAGCYRVLNETASGSQLPRPHARVVTQRLGDGMPWFVRAYRSASSGLHHSAGRTPVDGVVAARECRWSRRCACVPEQEQRLGLYW